MPCFFANVETPVASQIAFVDFDGVDVWKSLQSKPPIQLKRDAMMNNTSGKLYIVDYDVPRCPQSKRRAFYRKMSKLKKEMGLFGKMSTMSVVTTTDSQMAKQIYDLARKYGNANLYVCFSKSDH